MKHIFACMTLLLWDSCHGWLTSDFAMSFRQLYATAICGGYLLWELAAAICRGYFPWEFSSAICRSYLLWEFAVAICCGFFVCASNFFLYMWANFVYMEANFFYIWAKLLYSWKFFLLSVFSVLLPWQFQATADSILIIKFLL